MGTAGRDRLEGTDGEDQLTGAGGNMDQLPYPDDPTNRYHAIYQSEFHALPVKAPLAALIDSGSYELPIWSRERPAITVSLACWRSAAVVGFRTSGCNSRVSMRLQDSCVPAA